MNLPDAAAADPDGVLLVRLKDPTYVSAAGDTVVDPSALLWAPIPCYDNPAACGHVETACPECIHGWATDHDVRVALPDPDAPPETPCAP